MLGQKLMLIALITIGLVNAVSADLNDKNDDYDDQFQGDDDYAYDDDEIDKTGGGRSGPIEDNNTSNDPPYFEISELIENVIEGDDAILFCDVKNAKPNNVIIWYNGSQIIVQSKFILLNDRRITLMDNNAIKISKTTENDSNNYFCEVLPQKIRFNITLKVQSKPKVAILLDNRDINERSIRFDQGKNVEFECKAYGVINPSFKWSRNGERVVNNQLTKIDNGKIIFNSLDSHHAGLYQCLADDKSTDPPHGSFVLNINYKPKITIHRHFVNTENGDNPELYCEYKSEPIPEKLLWKHYEKLILNDFNKYNIKNGAHKEHNKTILIIRNVNERDLGEYVCEIENTIGASLAKIHLIYEPEMPHFEKIDIKGNKVSLHWLVRSKQPLVEAVLDYQINGSRTWMTETPISSEKHREHTGIWKIRHDLELQPGLWHARVKTKNTEGWSKFSHQHTFIVSEDFDDNSIPEDIIYTADIGSKSGLNSGTCSNFYMKNSILILISCLIIFKIVSIKKL